MTQQELMDMRINVLTVALTRLLDRYVEIAESGDAGYWDPEAQPEVRLARRALGQHGKA